MGLEMKQEAGIIGILILILLIIFLILNSLSPLLYWDENVYLGNARSHIGDSNFTEDFRFPLIEYIIAGAWFFTGESIFIARLIVILFTLATVFLLYLISKEYFSKLHSLFLCLMFSFSPLILVWSFRVYTDILAMFFVTLAFYFLLTKSTPSESAFAIALAGAASAIAFLARFSLVLFPISVIIYLIIKKDTKPLLIFVLLFIITLTPWLCYNQMTYGNPIWDLQEQHRVVAEWTYPEPIMKQIQNLFVFTNVLIPLLLIFGIYAMRKNNGLNYLILIYVLISLICYLFFVNLKDARYYLSFLPFIYIVSFRGLLWFNSTTKNKNNKNKNKIFKRAFTILCVTLVISGLFVFYQTGAFFSNENHCEVNHSITQAVNYLEDKTGDEDLILSNIWVYFGYSLNVEVYCLWDKDIDKLIDFYNPSYIVYDNLRGTEYKKETLDSCERLVLEKEFTNGCGETVYVYKVIS